MLAPYELRIKKEARFDCHVVPLDQLADQPLADYDAICLVDPGPLTDEAWQQLADYASAGGGMAIFLGRNARPVEAFNTSAAQQVLPGKLIRQWRAGDREVHLAPEHLEHPLLAKFRPLQSSVPWDAYPVYTHWELGPLAQGAGVVIAFSNTLPAIIEQPLGHGRVLTMTTPVSDAASDPEAWNLLPTGDEPWPFVVLANEMMYYLTSDSHSKLNYLAGETAILRLPADAHQSIFSLIPPEGDPLRQAVDERQNAIVVSNTDLPGNYRLQAGGEDGVRLGFSVNQPADTSRLERATPDELAQLFGDDSVSGGAEPGRDRPRRQPGARRPRALSAVDAVGPAGPVGRAVAGQSLLSPGRHLGRRAADARRRHRLEPPRVPAQRRLNWPVHHDPFLADRSDRRHGW